MLRSNSEVMRCTVRAMALRRTSSKTSSPNHTRPTTPITSPSSMTGTVAEASNPPRAAALAGNSLTRSARLPKNSAWFCSTLRM